MNKKIIIFFILFFSLVGFFFFFFGQTKRARLLPEKELQTPCRTVAIPHQKSLIKSSKKLTKLMNIPIGWVFKDIHNQVIDLYCFREKKILIINFWATWCPPCIEELPSLSRLAENNKDQILVVAISFEPLEVITNFLNQSFVDLSSQLIISQVKKEEKLQYFPEDSLPVTYIFNKEGLLRVKELGSRNWSEPDLVKQIRNLN